MGTTALTCSVGGSIFSLLIMKSFILAALVSLSFAAPAPEAEAKAEAVHPLPLIAAHAPLAVLPAKQLQWPGVSAPGLDKTCFGCRSAVVVPVGRRRREAEAEAEAAPEAEAEAAPEAEAEAAPEAEASAAGLYRLAVAPFAHYPLGYPVIPALALRSSGYAAVNNAGVSYSTGVHSVKVVPIGRKRRAAEAEADAEADADAFYTSLNGYAHNLGSGKSFAAISSGPSLPYVYLT